MASSSTPSGDPESEEKVLPKEEEVPKKEWSEFTAEITYLDFLKRFIYTNDYTGHYITGNPEAFLQFRNHEPLLKWIKENHKQFIDTIGTLNNDKLVSRRKNIFYLIAVALTSDVLGNTPQNDIKNDIRQTILKLVQSDQDFFDFIRYYTLLSRQGKNSPKLSKTLKKLVVKFYNSKTPTELAQTVTTYEKIHGWSHKDLVKLSHFKAQNILSDTVIQYVLFGFKSIENNENPEFQNILKHIKTAHELRICEDVNKTIILIADLKASVNQINSKLNTNQEVWAALIPYLSVREVLQSLSRFYRRGWLKAGSPVLEKVSHALNNEGRVKECKLHPIEVFIYKRTFEKGGKKIDPRFLAYLNKKDIKDEILQHYETPTEPKCPQLTQPLKNCIKLSYQNVQSTGKRILITFDNTKSDLGCFHNRAITASEAIFSIYRFLYKTERNLHAAVFVDSKIVLLEGTEQILSPPDFTKKLEQYKSQYIVPSAPLEWALTQKKPFDVFINLQSATWMSRTPKKFQEISPSEVLKKYSTSMNLPNTKLVRIVLESNKTGVTEISKNTLTIAGYTGEVALVLEAYCRGNFV